MRQFSHLVFAGTFDRLHIGHKKLLDKAFKLAEKVAIGITSEKLYKSKPLANLIQTWQVRRRAVEQYLRERNWLKRARFFKLNDIYGQSIVDKTMDSILVTKLTRRNAEKINRLRVRSYELGGNRKLKKLKIVVAALVRGDDGEVVTSERIRLGEIDREGHNFQLPSASWRSNFPKKALILPKYLRTELRKPLGKVIKGSEDQLLETAREVYRCIDSLIYTMVITVGDIITNSLLEVGFDPDVKIIDFRSRRKEIEVVDSATQFFITQESHPSTSLGVPSKVKKIAFTSSKYINQPGTINIKASRAIKIAIDNYFKTRKKQLIVVKGEEDLLALPAILFAPLQSVVLYGQIDLGVVMVEVAEEKKREVREILNKFR